MVNIFVDERGRGKGGGVWIVGKLVVDDKFYQRGKLDSHNNDITKQQI